MTDHQRTGEQKVLVVSGQLGEDGAVVRDEGEPLARAEDELGAPRRGEPRAAERADRREGRRVGLLGRAAERVALETLASAVGPRESRARGPRAS